MDKRILLNTFGCSLSKCSSFNSDVVEGKAPSSKPLTLAECFLKGWEASSFHNLLKTCSQVALKQGSQLRAAAVKTSGRALSGC